MGTDDPTAPPPPPLLSGGPAPSLEARWIALGMMAWRSEVQTVLKQSGIPLFAIVLPLCLTRLPVPRTRDFLSHFSRNMSLVRFSLRMGDCGGGGGTVVGSFALIHMYLKA